MFRYEDCEWFAVRCCCAPRKIFGFLKLEKIQGSSYTICDRKGKEHKLELKQFAQYLPDNDETVQNEYAIYSNDRPIEFWRTILGFVEASNV